MIDLLSLTYIRYKILLIGLNTQKVLANRKLTYESFVKSYKNCKSLGSLKNSINSHIL